MLPTRQGLDSYADKRARDPVFREECDADIEKIKQGIKDGTRPDFPALHEQKDVP